MGQAGCPTIGQAGPAGSWRIEDSHRVGPLRRISEANGANDGSTVEEVAVVGTPRWTVEARTLVLGSPVDFPSVLPSQIG